jgi:replicative DNA helicase
LVVAAASSDDILRRVPPQNLEAEQSVLGAILLENEAINQALEVLNPDDFYRESHREIFRDMAELSDRNQPVDAITMTDALRTRGKLEAIGGPAYITELAACVPTAANVAHYARIVREKAVLRALASTATEIASCAYDSPLDVAALLDHAEREVLAVRRTERGSVVRVSDDISTVLADFHRGLAGEKPAGITYTGISKLDQMIGGLGPSDMMLIAARPSMGKTSLITRIMEHNALADRSVLLFSAEMSRRDIITRMLCAAAKIDLLAFRHVQRGMAKMGQAAVDALHREAERIGALPIFVDELPGSVSVIRAKARRLAHKVKLGAIFVDYLQMLEVEDRRANRERQVAEMSVGLKRLAKELQVPVIAAAQLNRQPAGRTDHRPQISDLRESGALEQDADVIVFLHREIVWARQTGADTGKIDGELAELSVAKQRNGPQGKMAITFIESYARFEDGKIAS